MRRIIFIIVSFNIMLIPLTGLCEMDQAQIVSSFEQRVNKFEELLSTNPKILFQEKHSKSKTGEIFYYKGIIKNKLSYDVQKTDSLVSAYMGYIYLDFVEAKSTCGDVESYLGNIFSTLDAARKNLKEDCFNVISKPVAPGSTVTINNIRNGKVKFSFAYQKNMWTFKDVNNVDNSYDEVLFKTAMCISGKGTRPCLVDNNNWRQLIQ